MERMKLGREVRTKGLREVKQELGRERENVGDINKE